MPILRFVCPMCGNVRDVYHAPSAEYPPLYLAECPEHPRTGYGVPAAPGLVAHVYRGRVGEERHE